MNNLNKSLQYLEDIYQKEQAKKRKIYNLKEEKKVFTSSDGLVKMFLKKKEQQERKNIMRLKSLRNAKEQVISDDFDAKYKAQQDNIFSRPWKKLNKQIKLNRVYKYMKLRKDELEWTTEEYEEKLETVKDHLDLNGLRKLVEYDEEEGIIDYCWLVDTKPKDESKEEDKTE